MRTNGNARRTGRTGTRRSSSTRSPHRGHGKVTIRLDERGAVSQGDSRRRVRGFERFVQGRLYWEVPVIVQRLCGICPVSHLLCAAKAMDVMSGPTSCRRPLKRCGA